VAAKIRGVVMWATEQEEAMSTNAPLLRKDSPLEMYTNADTLTLPDVLLGFAVPVAHFFE